VHSTVAVSIADPEEVAYWEHRKVVRRRQLIGTLCLVSVALSFVAQKVVMHLTSTWWLEANHFVVLWGIEKENWKQGGSTMVRYKGRSWYLVNPEQESIDLKHLGNLHRVEELNLAQLIGIRDADLERIDELTSMKRLNLDRSRISEFGRLDAGLLTDATLARIGRLDQLIELNLGNHRISDAGLKSLEGLDRLENLELTETDISDIGLESLKNLKGLKSLDLSGTKVTASGVAEFEKARPFVKVLSNPPALPSPTTTPR